MEEEEAKIKRGKEGARKHKPTANNIHELILRQKGRQLLKNTELH